MQAWALHEREPTERAWLSNRYYPIRQALFQWARSLTRVRWSLDQDDVPDADVEDLEVHVGVGGLGLPDGGPDVTVVLQLVGVVLAEVVADGALEVDPAGGDLLAAQAVSEREVHLGTGVQLAAEAPGAAKLVAERGCRLVDDVAAVDGEREANDEVMPGDDELGVSLGDVDHTTSKCRTV